MAGKYGKGKMHNKSGKTGGSGGGSSLKRMGKPASKMDASKAVRGSGGNSKRKK